MTLKERLDAYERLMRLDKPIGILLLLWPALWALWLAKYGIPDLDVLVIFVVGVVLTRSAGCIINDYADRNFDPHVERTRDRPLAAGRGEPRARRCGSPARCCVARLRARAASEERARHRALLRRARDS